MSKLPLPRPRLLLGMLCLAAVTSGAMGLRWRASAPAATAATEASDAATIARRRTLGQLVFGDRSLSLRRNQSCASCHDAAWGFSAPDPARNSRGGVMPGSLSTRFGRRKPPSAAYAAFAPVLHQVGVSRIWVGGAFWDGRATGRRLGNAAAEQAQVPLLDHDEQALPDAACVVYRVLRGSYGRVAAAALGARAAAVRFPAATDAQCAREDGVVALPAADRAIVNEALDEIGRAVAEFERSPAVSAFSSKYDAVLAGHATLTDEERLGLDLFERKAGCAACHPNAGEHPLFTNFGYENIGVPPNPRNAARLADPTFRDPGLGPVVHEGAMTANYKVPTLRNVNRRGEAGALKTYMHNGAFTSLEEVVHFYNTRNTLPDCARVRHPVVGRNCWPAPEFAPTVEDEELGRLGLTPAEERALVAYLRTLDDGWVAEARR